MNNLGEIQLKNEIKIVDAFDFPEQFSVVHLKNIKEGAWLAFNRIAFSEDEMENQVVTDFLVIEKNYFLENSHFQSYPWRTQEQPLFIEKGVIGIFNKEFVESENYINEMDKVTSNDHFAGVTKDYIACYTPYAQDGDFSFDIVKDNNQVIAIKINFDINS